MDTSAKKRSAKAVTPVIATIIIIAATIVLALVVGAYTFGLFGSNVKTITLDSANLIAGNLEPLGKANPCNNSGEAYATLAINDPGGTTNISDFSLTSPSLGGEVLADYFLLSTQSSSSSSSFCLLLCPPPGPSGPSNTCAMLVPRGAQPQLIGGGVMSITLYFGNSTKILSGQPTSLTSGETFDYSLGFGNGQSISGTLIAQ